MKFDSETAKILRRIAIDAAILACLLFFEHLLHYGVTAFHRGFFCNDQSLMYPYHDSTVGTSLFTVGYGLPLFIIAVTEIIRWKLNLDKDRKVKLFNREVPFFVIEGYKHIGVFLFGSYLTLVSTDLGKHVIGRLRPHFFDVCLPILTDGTNCSNPINHNRYITNYSCANSKSSEDQLSEVRLSFPSGHSSFSMYVMFFAALYLQSRLNWKGSKLLKHFLQFILIMMAFFTALSRISDYKHHWSDVLGGSVLGISIAFATVFAVSDLTRRPTYEVKNTDCT